MKKTLIFNGSPRLRGDTMTLINRLIPKLEGECRIVNTCNRKISPCIDCRYCWEHAGCAFVDDMQNIYNYIEDCDNILIASPIYFSELTGQLLCVGSRFQTYFAAKYFRNEIPIEKPKRGGVILVAGGDANDPNKPYSTACSLLNTMNCSEIHPLIEFHNTNTIRATEREEADALLNDLAAYFNSDWD
jgi:multimeric flavodoxin WrbA